MKAPLAALLYEMERERVEAWAPAYARSRRASYHWDKLDIEAVTWSQNDPIISIG